MRDTFLRPITDDERNFLYNMIEQDDEESSYRAKIILLKDEGYTDSRNKDGNQSSRYQHKKVDNIVSMRKVLKESYPENICINHSKR